MFSNLTNTPSSRNFQNTLKMHILWTASTAKAVRVSSFLGDFEQMACEVLNKCDCH